jgi:hypothetical protein
LSELHQQAINYVYLQVLQKLQCHYSHRQRLALEQLIGRTILAAGGPERLSAFRVMVAHNGGRESSQVVAFLRAAQLSLALRCGQTFVLRIVTCRQETLAEPATGNLRRLYCALFVDDDPRVETLLADEHEASTFSLPDPGTAPLPGPRRIDLLMAGQITGGDARATFCHLDHQRYAQSLQHGLSWGSGASALVRLESPRQRHQYQLWARQVSRRAQSLQHAAQGEVADELVRSFCTLNAGLGKPPCVPRTVKSLDLNDLMGEILDTPSMPLLEFLGFRLTDLSGAVGLVDCAHPLLLAHIAGLRAEGLTLLDYRDGVEHYLNLAGVLLRERKLPQPLIRAGLASYATKAALVAHRKRANALLKARYGLGEKQLLCMLFAPFVDQAAGLGRYLRHCHQSMPRALPYMHRALCGEEVPKPVEQWLTDVSGLPLAHLRRLYGMARVHVDDNQTLLAQVRHWPLSHRGPRGLHPVTGLPALRATPPAAGSADV